MDKKSTGRNRSQGWTHAKKSGHQNEKDFGKQLLDDRGFVKSLEYRKFSKESKAIPEIVVDGAKKVLSIFGDQTTSKIDLELVWADHRAVRVSLKKSAGGQVWLISLERFLKCLEHYTAKRPPKDVGLALGLFIGGSNLDAIQAKFERALKKDLAVRPTIYTQEANQKRLVAKSIQDNFPGAWEELMGYLGENIELITNLSFGRGLAKSETDWADFVVYNLAGAEQTFEIPRLAQLSTHLVEREPIVAGPRNGGSTILLPTGFVQMHHPQGQNLLQFHHSYEKIQTLLNQ